MGQQTKIEWTDATWNPVLGCSRVSEGCRHCYAERIAARFGDHSRTGSRKATVYDGLTQITNGHPQWTGKIVETRQLLQPLSWRKPRRVFVNSMSDLFHENVTRQMQIDIAGVMVLAYWHTFQVLTKRPENARTWTEAVAEAVEIMQAINDQGGIADGRVFRALDMRRRDKIPWKTPLPNAWLGVSVENQVAADERIPPLLQTPAAVRFVSCEPLLGPINLTSWLDAAFTVNVRECKPMSSQTAHALGKMARAAYKQAGSPLLDWVICGGESGPGARPMHPDWARSLRDQCQAAGVPFFFKQWGEWEPSFDFAGGQFDDVKPSTPTCRMAADGFIGYSQAEMAGHGRHGLMVRSGKKHAGALLDGREWKEFPEALTSAPAEGQETPCGRRR